LDWSIPRENSHRKVLCFQRLLGEFFRRRQGAKIKQRPKVFLFSSRLGVVA
jgi:hypothetical protein